MNKATKKELFIKIGGREGISKRILELAQQIALVDSYKRAIIGAGQIRVLAEIAEADAYWGEKMSVGMDYEKRISQGYKKVTFNSLGTAEEQP